MYHAIKVVLFGGIFFITASASAHALETSQLTLQSNPFSARYLGVVEAPEIETQGDDQKATENKEEQPAPEGKPTPLPKPEPKVHVIAAGENLSKIATAYRTTWDRIFAKNESIQNPDVVTPGMEIVIPREDEILPERTAPAPQPVPHAAAPTAYTPATRPLYGNTAGNTYAAGYCTWYAKNKRPDLPNMLGNAVSWVANAAARGYATGAAPRVGAIGQQGNHVVYVESVNPDGTVSISEMNYGGGLFVVHHRTVPASSFTYIY